MRSTGSKEEAEETEDGPGICLEIGSLLQQRRGRSFLTYPGTVAFLYLRQNPRHHPSHDRDTTLPLILEWQSDHLPDVEL